ncbi:MAG: tyrosine-type recombinase/integrase [Candidatus Entotheonellia bacterium]
MRLYTLFFGTGLRPSELYALEWQHVDFNRKLIYVRQGFVKAVSLS